MFTQAISCAHRQNAPTHASLAAPMRFFPQVRVPVADVAAVVRSLVDSATSWADVQAKYPAQAVKEEEADA